MIESQNRSTSLSTSFVRSVASRSVRRAVIVWSRWLHIYLSMFAFAVMLFFSVTGLTLNHPDWFFDETVKQMQGRLSRDALHNFAPPPADWDQYDYGHEIDKLEVVEQLRRAYSITGAVSDFVAFEDECEVTFEAPGYAATARIDRRSGIYTLDVAQNDFVSVLNDLHKGRHAGAAWSWLIDASAVFCTLAAGTGFVLIFFLRLHRISGLLCAAAGAIVFVACAIWATT
ncbi:MAG: PepSY-associated TM helix domain-containing protein [Planctomycetales bacterium]|nr:PepSY-associated TM helix domain-containing protein [Planctomycetales bacterium]